MSVEEQIKKHIGSQPEPKKSDLQALHERTLKGAPGSKLWFDNGKNAENKTVTNPTIGYGLQTLKYADGKTKEFFRIGISTNTTGISVYVLGLKDKTFLAKKFGKRIGKATVTGYCIRFKSLKEIDVDVLEEAIRYGFSVVE
jgi:hypothetical protein